MVSCRAGNFVTEWQRNRIILVAEQISCWINWRRRNVRYVHCHVTYSLHVGLEAATKDTIGLRPIVSLAATLWCQSTNNNCIHGSSITPCARESLTQSSAHGNSPVGPHDCRHVCQYYSCDIFDVKNVIKFNAKIMRSSLHYSLVSDGQSNVDCNYLLPMYTCT
jgi:hypothetical protein